MERLIAPRGLKLGIFRCLKSGVNPEYPEQGTPQGGVVSPLLANIALNGIEEIHQSVRYADDMVIILKPKDNAEAILDKISQFLAERGMKVSEKKTKLTATTDGFDFLGWHFKVQSNGKFRSVPSVDNFKAFRQKVKRIVNSSNIGATTKAEKLAPVVRGWRNYHRRQQDGREKILLVPYPKQSVQGVQQGSQKRQTQCQSNIRQGISNGSLLRKQTCQRQR